MHLVSSQISPRPTWTRFIGTIVITLACIVAAITTFAEPADSNREIQFGDEATATQKVGGP
jgi:CDP-diglyceride synthetase